jgi:hypothetical protein
VKFANPFTASNYQDCFSFSKLGGRLCIYGESVVSWEDRVASGGDDKALRQIDESISKVGGILEQMKNVANLAQDDSLSDLDRIDLQIQMERLQKNLLGETAKFRMRREGKSEKEIAELLAYIYEEDPDSMLQRARNRIINGEEWDVRETFDLITVSKGVKAATPDGWQSLQQNAEGEYVLPEGMKIEESARINEFEWGYGGHFVATQNKSVPTLLEFMEMTNGIIIMDSGSAAEAVELIGKKLKGLTKERKTLVEFIEKNGAKPTAANEENSMHTPANILLSRLERFFDSLVEAYAPPKDLTNDDINFIGPAQDENGKSIIPNMPKVVEAAGAQ